MTLIFVVLFLVLTVKKRIQGNNEGVGGGEGVRGGGVQWSLRCFEVWREVMVCIIYIRRNFF